ncbi:hypothetical protein [Microbacterium soli]|uniref:hypothetical protein n=1 Tax=Microbacterium soli TaxID=446075 RepID=UPI0031DDBFE9
MAIEPIVSETTQVDPGFWLKAANRAVRAECGWHVAPIITEELVLDGPGGTTLLVPSKRVRGIISATSDGRDVTDKVRFSRRAGVLTLESGWSCEVGSIELKIQHGYDLDEVPDVAALIVTLTKRAASGGPVVQQAVGPASVRLATGRDGAALGVPLLESEKDVLAPYKLNWGP